MALLLLWAAIKSWQVTNYCLEIKLFADKTNAYQILGDSGKTALASNDSVM